MSTPYKRYRVFKRYLDTDWKEGVKVVSLWMYVGDSCAVSPAKAMSNVRFRYDINLCPYDIGNDEAEWVELGAVEIGRDDPPGFPGDTYTGEIKDTM